MSSAPGGGGQGVFEMLWDCEYCGTKGLLGKTHRHCPRCGAPQDPGRRYFPPPGEEVSARNLEYDGADRTCPACASPGSARAAHCSNCGSPLAGAGEVAPVADPLAPQAPRSPRGSAPRAAALTSTTLPGRRRRLLPVFALLALGIVGLIVLLRWKKETLVTVAAHSWSREIAVERLEAVAESSWCDDLPGGAYAVSRSREVRSHRQVADGQRCQTVRADRGDGTFVQREECETVYRDEPVYDQRCRYQIDRWRTARKLLAEGRSLAEAPSWPPQALSLGAAPCDSRGCERPGARRERYLVELRTSDGKRHTCEVPEAAWRRHPDSSRRPIPVSVVTGRPDCKSLTR